jgi:hypothetical protein
MQAPLHEQCPLAVRTSSLFAADARDTTSAIGMQLGIVKKLCEWMCSSVAELEMQTHASAGTRALQALPHANRFCAKSMAGAVRLREKHPSARRTARANGCAARSNMRCPDCCGRTVLAAKFGIRRRLALKPTVERRAKRVLLVPSAAAGVSRYS